MAHPPLSVFCLRGLLLAATTAVAPADALCTESVDQLGRILVPVMLNGRGPFRFVVDTGASHSTISPRTAAALGLPLETDSLVSVNGITGREELPAVAIGQLEAGDLVMRDMRLPVVAAPMLADSDGILGAAGLTHERLLVDFVHNSVVISRGHGPGAVADFARIPGKRLAGERARAYASAVTSAGLLTRLTRLADTPAAASIAASANIPGLNEPLVSFSHPTRYGPTKPPRLPVALMKAMVPQMAVPERKVGRIEKNAGRQAFIPMRAIAIPVKVSGRDE